MRLFHVRTRHSTCWCAALLFPGAVLLARGCAAGEFTILDFGAQGGRKVSQRAAVQAAVDACANAGGGTVVVPPGEYLSGTISLRDQVTLRLEKGATLYASTDPRDYDNSKRGYLLFADGAKDIAVVGEGALHGQATADYGARWGAPEPPAFRTGIIMFQRCRNVTLRGISILYSDAWTVHLKRCDTVAIEGLTIRNNYKRLNSDGIDPNSCAHVRISKCDIVAGDDAIVLKSTEPFPCEDIEVRDCTLESATAALKLGTESQGDFRDIVFRDCVIRNSPVGVGLYLKDGATMEKITAANIKMEMCEPAHHEVAPLFIDIEKRHADSKVGRVRDVAFRDMEIKTGSGILIQGMPESPIENLKLENIKLLVEKADDYARRKKPVGGKRTTRDERDTLYARLATYAALAHIKGLSVENFEVRIGSEAFGQAERSALACRHVDGGSLRQVRRTPPAVAVQPETQNLKPETPSVDVQDCQGVKVE